MVLKASVLVAAAAAALDGGEGRSLDNM